MSRFSLHNSPVLAGRLKSGDMTAFRQVFDLFSKDLLGFLTAMLKSREDAEEAVQETFARLWEGRANLREDTSLKSYIFTIGVNHAKMILRRRKYNYAYINYQQANEPVSYEFAPEAAEFQRLYDVAVSKLPPERQKIYILCRHENLSHKEVAACLNISPKTVENQMSKAIKFLQAFLIQYKDAAIVLTLVHELLP